MQEAASEQGEPFHRFPNILGWAEGEACGIGGDEPRKTPQISEKTTHFSEKTPRNLKKTLQIFFIYVRLTP